MHYYCHMKLKGIDRLDTFDYYMWLRVLLYLSGDVEVNPGPINDSSDSRNSSSLFSDSMLNESEMVRENFSIVHYNVQSALQKLDILETELSNFDVISFSETWFKKEINNSDIAITNYRQPFRNDRENDPHGGVAVYVKNNIPCMRRTELEILNVESVWIEIRLKYKRLLIGTFYRPPNSDQSVLSNIERSIDLAIDTGISDIIILGDFNLNMLKPVSSRPISNICQQYNLQQIITEPTHFTETSNSLIDLVLVSNPESILLSGVGDPFLGQEIRYHCPIFVVFKYNRNQALSFKRQIWKYQEGDYELLKHMISNTDWETFRNDDIDTYAVNVTDHILNLTKECIPNKTVKIRQSDPPWMHNNLRKLMRQRKRAYDKAKKTNSQQQWQKYKRLRNETTNMLRSSKREYFEKMANKLNTNVTSSRDWWKILKTFITTTKSSNIPPMKSNNEFFTEDKDKAKLLNNYFKTQSSLNDDGKILPQVNKINANDLSVIMTSPDEVKSVLETLKIGKASGPDYINNYVLKMCAAELSEPLSKLFNYSLSQSKVPKIWKEANVTPVFKKDDPSDYRNYRPISLLSTVGKVLERIIHKHTYNFFIANNVISSLQSGFVMGDSTVNQLTDIYNTFCRALDNGLEVRAIFCDISKAFDRVWHKGLLSKLESVGISGGLLRWFCDYLDNRKQRVVLPGASSDWVTINAGVPQGSILGPLLFLVYINDIVTDIKSHIRLFADDTTLYIIVDTPAQAALTLNQDLVKISAWANKWLVSFNPNKTESLLLSRKINRQIHPAITMNNQIITEVENHKHLGVVFQSNCTWHEHLNMIISKAWQRINVMRKLKFVLDRKSLQCIYFSFIRPVLEYADVVWDNCTKYEEDELEKIQLEAARIVTGTTKLVSIDNLYSETGWETLKSRRKQHKLILFYKMVNNLTPIYLSSLLPPQVGNISRYNLRNQDKYQTINCKSQLYFNSFLPSSVRDWNLTEDTVRLTQSVNCFKRSIKVTRDIPKYYFSGDRKGQILHTRLRTGCSSLNYHLFCKNIINDELCVCGNREDTNHFLFVCPRFQMQRQIMVNKLLSMCNISLHVLLYGDNSLSFQQNVEIFQIVQDFIVRTKRFS